VGFAASAPEVTRLFADVFRRSSSSYGGRCRSRKRYAFRIEFRPVEFRFDTLDKR
jgi:hypothetical protein